MRETLDSHITRHRVSNCALVTRHTDGEQRAINHSKLKFVASTPTPSTFYVLSLRIPVSSFSPAP